VTLIAKPKQHFRTVIQNEAALEYCWRSPAPSRMARRWKSVAKRKPPATKGKSARPKVAPRSLTERLRSVIGKAKHIPLDASVNHDHYLYGLPKQQ